jgi:hypothetical protein
VVLFWVGEKTTTFYCNASSDLKKTHLFEFAAEKFHVARVSRTVCCVKIVNEQFYHMHAM